MLTMTYILVQKRVIHLVTVKKSFTCVALGNRGGAIWEGGLQADQLQDISMAVGHPGARTAVY